MEWDKPGRDELLDAYDVIIRETPTSLRVRLDSVYEAGFAAGVKAMQQQKARASEDVRNTLGSA